MDIDAQMLFLIGIIIGMYSIFAKNGARNPAFVVSMLFCASGLLFLVLESV